MTWVHTTPNAGSLDNVLASHSLNPNALEAHLALHRTIMFGPSGLSRAEREAMAVCVSAANDCPTELPTTAPRWPGRLARHWRRRSSPVTSKPCRGGCDCSVAMP
jgi:hypothetical protein